MKKIIIIIAIVLLGGNHQFTYGQVKKSDLEKEVLVGNVRSMIYIEKVIENGSSDRYEYEYNEKGNLTGEKQFYNGDLLADWVYEFDMNGFLISKKDNQNLLVFEKYQNDAHGNRIETYLSDELDYYYEITNYILDSKGNIIEETFEAPDYNDKTTYQRDDKGNVLETYRNNDYSSIKETRYLKYNDKGLLEEEYVIYMSSESQDTTFTTLKYSYHDNGKLSTESSVSADSSIFSSYDTHGNLVIQEIFTQAVETLLLTYEYEYDTIGNWTKKSSSSNNVLTQVEERVISYFEI